MPEGHGRALVVRIEIEELRALVADEVERRARSAAGNADALRECEDALERESANIRLLPDREHSL
jgi:hypothetical protein